MNTNFARKMGLLALLSGILVVISSAIHPATEDPTSILSDMWVPAHFLGWVGFSLSVLGWIGVYEVISSKSGQLGLWGFKLLVLGCVFLAGIYFVAFSIEPILAANTPAVLETIANSSTNLFIFIVSVFVLGSVLFGYEVFRSKMLNKWGGALLIIGSIIAFAAFLLSYPEKVIGAGIAVFGLGQVLLGYSVWKKK